jgi:hypothetical protein
VAEIGWHSSNDASLLALAEKGFDVLVTVDRRLSAENDLSQYQLGFVIATLPNTLLKSFEPIFGRLKQARRASNLAR